MYGTPDPASCVQQKQALAGSMGNLQRRYRVDSSTLLLHFRFRFQFVLYLSELHHSASRTILNQSNIPQPAALAVP